MLLAALDNGPEAEFLLSQKQEFAVKELRQAEKNIAGALNTFGLDEIEVHKEDIEFYAHLSDLRRCQSIVTAALKALSASRKELKSRTGRPARRDAQGITECCMTVWRHWTGKSAGKNNTGFHALLSATWITVYGPQIGEPNWEHQIKRTQKQRG
jgi:hypothetical protein